MLDTSFVAARTRPPGATASAQSLPRGFIVRASTPSARFSLRVRQAPESVGDFRLDQSINRFVAVGDRWAAKLGPDEWLIGAAEADAELIQQEIETALHNVPHALVDVSHRNVAFEISGPDAAAALNAGCPLDLHGSAFPAGSATRTLLGKAEVVLIRPSEDRAYRVECWRSFSTYVQGFLVEAVHGLGIAS